MPYALSVWAGWVAWKDWRQQRVPNVLLLLILVPALLSLLVNRQGLLQVPIAESLLGFVTAGAILLPGYMLGHMGAGDVKFAACLGLLLGLPAALKMLVVFGLTLGAMSVLALWFYRRQPQAHKRRIAAAPALVLGFISQLFISEISGLL